MCQLQARVGLQQALLTFQHIALPKASLSWPYVGRMGVTCRLACALNKQFIPLEGALLARLQRETEGGFASLFNACVHSCVPTCLFGIGGCPSAVSAGLVDVGEVFSPSDLVIRILYNFILRFIDIPIYSLFHSCEYVLHHLTGLPSSVISCEAILGDAQCHWVPFEAQNKQHCNVLLSRPVH